MELGAKAKLVREVSASVQGPDGEWCDFGLVHTRRYWFRVFCWNLDHGHLRALAMNLRDFPRYMVGRG